MSDTFSRKITIYSFIMTLFIVLYHMSIFNDYNIYYISGLDKIIYIYFRRFFDLTAAIALGFFFTTSSFFLYINANEKNTLSKAKRRFKSLGIPFVIWNIIECIFLIFKYKEQINGIRSIFLLVSFDPFDGPLWYVFQLLVMTALSPIIIKKKKRRAKENVVIFVLISLVCFSCSIAYHNGIILNGLYWFERIIRYMPAYLSGIFLAWYGERLYKENYNIKKVETIYRIVSILALIFIIIIGGTEGNVVCFLLFRILPISIWFSFHCKSKEKITLFPIKISFMIYVMHDMCIRIIGWGFYKMFREKAFAGYQIVFMRFVMVIVVYFIIFIITYVIYKMSPKLYNILTGGR